MILDFFPENALGDGPINTRIRVKSVTKNDQNIRIRPKFGNLDLTSKMLNFRVPPYVDEFTFATFFKVDSN